MKPRGHFPFPVKKIRSNFSNYRLHEIRNPVFGRKKTAVSNLGRMYPMKVHFGSDEFDASRPPRLVLKIL